MGVVVPHRRIQIIWYLAVSRPAPVYSLRRQVVLVKGYIHMYMYMYTCTCMYMYNYTALECTLSMNECMYTAHMWKMHNCTYKYCMSM